MSIITWRTYRPRSVLRPQDTVWEPTPLWYTAHVQEYGASPELMYATLREKPGSFISWIWHVQGSPCLGRPHARLGGRKHKKNQPLRQTLGHLLESGTVYAPLRFLCPSCLYGVMPHLAPAEDGFEWSQT